MNLESKIEAILFWKGEPVSLKKLADILKVPKEEVKSAIENLKSTFASRGIVLQEREEEIALGTAPELSAMFEELQKEELSRDLSKASLETLSIVLYKGGASRSEIDYIRGVNSSFTLRALAVRGLVEKVIDPKDARRFLYKPTFELLSYMGVKSLEELPEYSDIKNSIDATAEKLAEDIKNEGDI